MAMFPHIFSALSANDHVLVSIVFVALLSILVVDADQKPTAALKPVASFDGYDVFHEVVAVVEVVDMLPLKCSLVLTTATVDARPPATSAHESALDTRISILSVLS
ncbi:hypothetical protein KP509_13G059300 [Ceratopteris richardii]|uniref:Uncharacterized protein n=1 Tax=Ceratopteris richardii TaxID=49495 RepID=A0A8T2TDW8_CERRI|nr:hypothetical protein KP509_13G059300 [Ceratopteris richardii]